MNCCVGLKQGAHTKYLSAELSFMGMATGGLPEITVCFKNRHKQYGYGYSTFTTNGEQDGMVHIKWEVNRVLVKYAAQQNASMLLPSRML